jgi:riboflavin biosynthesis pyrimidine reductase
VSTLQPLTLVYDRGDVPPFPLPAELQRLYGGELGLPERCVFANFVSTIDGVVAIPSLRRSNRLISEDSEADRFVMALLRACADVVLVGSGTLIGSPTARWQAEGAYPPAAAELAELRRLLGRPAGPEVAVVTGSGSIDPAHPAIRAGALVLTTARGAAKLADRLPDPARAAVLPGELEVDLRAALSFLHASGHERILSEAGPTLFGALAASGLVDELFLTVSPLLGSRSGAESKLGLVEHTELLPSRRLRTHLRSVRLHGDHLFVRYELEPPVAAGQSEAAST